MGAIIFVIIPGDYFTGSDLKHPWDKLTITTYIVTPMPKKVSPSEQKLTNLYSYYVI